VEEIKKKSSITFFFFENRAFYEIMWEYIVERCRTQMTMRIACWMTKATNTDSEYVILTHIAFPYNNGYANASQCYVYIYMACLVVSAFFVEFKKIR